MNSIDTDLITAALRSSYDAANGSLLRWPEDTRLREDAIARHQRGEVEPARAAFEAAFLAMVQRVGKLCQGAALLRARQMVAVSGLVLPGGAWLPLHARLADLTGWLERTRGALAERVRELELDDVETCVAVVRAVAEVLAAQWAAMPAPRDEDVPGTPAYRVRLRAEIASEVAEGDRQLARVGKLCAMHRSGL